MKKVLKTSQKLNSAFAFILMTIAGAALNTSSFLFWGEPEPPKNLSKN